MSDDQPKYLYDGISSAGVARVADVADPDNVRHWLGIDDGSVQRTEWALNHVHLYDEIEQGWDEPQELLDTRLLDAANRIAAAWRASLAAAFPGRTFSIEVVSSEAEHGPTVYLVSR